MKKPFKIYPLKNDDLLSSVGIDVDDVVYVCDSNKKLIELLWKMLEKLIKLGNK